MLHFVTDSYPMRVKRVSCDKEIGHYSRGWHACNKRATVEKESRFGNLLHYCAKHAPTNATPVQP